MRLEEATALVAGRKDFVVKSGPEYTVIDYVYTAPDTFDDPRRVELRGAKFGPDGDLIARPLHKFFNVGERPEVAPDKINWGQPHAVTEKLDGSMVHPAVLGCRVTLMTRMGETDVARACMERHGRAVIRLAACGFDPREWTPCFEWVSPANRVVVGYPEDRLVLLAMRTVEGGTYLPRDLLHGWAKDWGLEVPRVLATDAYGDWAGLARHTQGLEDAEGYVVWFADGSAVKVKAPWYVTRHRALDGLRFEHHVVKLVLDSGLDDVLPILSQGDRDRLRLYSKQLHADLWTLGRRIDDDVARYRSLTVDRKGFVALVAADIKPTMRPVYFSTYDGGDATGHLTDYVLRACASGTRLADTLDNLQLPRWVR